MSTDRVVATSTGRGFLLACIIAVVLLLATLWGLMRWQQSAIVDTLASDRLQASRAAQTLVEEQRAVDIATRAELIAGNQAFVGYVEQALGGALPGEQVDTASIVDLLGERSGQLGLTLAAVLDEQGRMVAATQSFTPRRRLGDDPLFLKARDSETTATGLWLDVDRLLQIAIRPLAPDGSSEGFLVVGMLINDNFVESIAQVGGNQVAIVANASGGRVISASTLDANLHEALLAALPTKIAEGGEPFALSFGNQRALASMTRLFDSEDGQLVTLTTVKADPQQDAISALQFPLLAGGAMVLIALLAASAALWRRVLAPADALSQLMERAAAGDHRLTFNENAGVFRRMADAFNALMASIDRR